MNHNRWIVRDLPTQGLYIGPADDGGAPSIAVVLSSVSTTDAERMARARLIAAAPELLAALTAMLTHMGMDEDEWNKPTFDQARTAIAKATGERA